jgi:hypothetical protein
MKLSLLSASAIFAGSAALFASCASAGGSPAAAGTATKAVSAATSDTEGAAVPAAAQKVAKTRTVVVKTPVLAKESVFYADGVLDRFTIYAYDESKTRLLETASYEESRPEPVERVVSEWKDGRLASDTVFESEGKVKLRREYGYDAAGRLASARVLDAEGQTRSSSTYLYDDTGAKIEWRAFDGAGLLKAVTRYSPTRIDLLDAAGVAKGAIAIETGPGGRIVKRSYVGVDGSLQKVEAYLYAATPQPAAKETRRADGSLVSRTSYAYGPLGELVESRTEDGTGALREFSRYEYYLREDSKTETYYDNE